MCIFYSTLDSRLEKDKAEKIKMEEDEKSKTAVIDDMMAALESLAPSKQTETSKKESPESGDRHHWRSKRSRSRSPRHRRNRSRSRSPKRRSRSRSPSKRRRSRSRDRDRERDRDRSRKDNRRRSRSRSRSRDRRRGSKEHDRERTRDKRSETIKIDKSYLSDKLPPAEPEVGKVIFNCM